ncbi:MAG TPA: hypothetical protein VGW11_11890 [Solirubrobacteraceae bacterium]|nr:hypothetical protein [Solirubrobacteraceae bacterium]
MERADFVMTDPMYVIEAALSCPMCLHTVAWRPANFGAHPTVECTCPACGHQRPVGLSGPQLLRLTAGQEDDEGRLLPPGLAAAWPPPY